MGRECLGVRQQLWDRFCWKKSRARRVIWTLAEPNPSTTLRTSSGMARTAKPESVVALDPKHPRRLASEAELLALRPEL